MFATVLRHLSFVGWLRYWLFDRYYNITVRVILMGICFIFTILSALLSRNIALSSLTSVLSSSLIIIIMAVLTVSIFMYRNMQTMPLVVLVLSTTVSVGIGTGTGTSLSFTFLTLILWSVIWLFRLVVVEKRFDLRPSFANLPIWLFIIAVIVAFVWSGAFPEQSASYLFNQKANVRLTTALTLIISPLTYILFSNVIRSERTFKILVWWFISFGIVTALMHISGIGVKSPLNAKGQFPTWFIAFAFGQLLFNKNLTWYIKLLLFGGSAIWIRITLGLGLTWLSGWLPVAVVASTLIFFYSRKLFAFVILGIIIWGALNISFVNQTFGEEQDISGNTRSVAWSRTFGVIGKHFLFGAGPAGYEYYFQSYGYYEGAVGTANLSHNNYIDIIAQTGVVGFTVWIILWAGQGWMIWKLFRKHIDYPFLSALRYSLVAGYPAILVSMMLGDWVTPFPYTQTLAGIDYTIWAWMLSGMAIALYYYNPKGSVSSLVVKPSM